jgi:cytochrome c-type biogenesis protein CcmH
MWIFWITAGGLAAAAAALIFSRSAAAARRAADPAEDPALAVYRRQLGELDLLVGRGVMGPDEFQAARAEAGRRLLSAADVGRRAERPGGRAARISVAVAATVAAVIAMSLYLKLGSPGLKDQPYQARLAAWRSADPAMLGPPQMAALLRALSQQRPHDPKVYDYLGRAELSAGDAVAAAEAFRKAAQLAPGRADLQAMLGEALSLSVDGPPPPEAKQAFQQALALDPRNAPARYYLGRVEIAAGQVTQGLAMWRGLAADLPAVDPHRTALIAEIDAVQSHSADAAAAPTSSAQGADSEQIPAAQLAFIRGMVAKQAADLAAHPDDPEGWARLVRSYGVLGDRTAQAQALVRARKLFAGRPDALRLIETEAPTAMAAHEKGREASDASRPAEAGE